MKKRDEYLVYQFYGTLTDQEIKMPKDLSWKWIEREDLDRFFANDPWRQKTFGEFLSKGYIGVLLHQEGQWLSYGWMSTPGSHPPPHLPKWVRKYRPFWLFYAHTREEFRGRGYQKLTLRLRIRRALTHEREIGPIFVDIEKWNLPSYRALASLQFRPSGVIHTHKLGIPRVFVFRVGKWQSTQPHPLLFSQETLREIATSQLELPVAVQELQIREKSASDQAVQMPSSSPYPLFLEGWQEFIKIKWGLQPIRLRFEENKLDPPTIEAVFYLTKDGKLRQPPGNIYLPLSFRNAPNTRYDRTYRQWVQMAERLADEMYERGLSGALAFPPSILDVRPWQWAGFKAGVKYTIRTEFPYSFEKIDSAARNRARKAQKHGYRCERTTNFKDVLACLESTSQRQEFENTYSLLDLQLANELVGEEYFRAYVCYAPNGEPASAQIRLHVPGHISLGLEAGNKEAHLQNGVNQQLIDYAMVDIQEAGATGFDFAGANIKHVALAKVDWNAQLVPYFTVEPYDFKSFAKWGLQAIQARRDHKKEP